MMASFSEGLLLSEEVGLDNRVLVEVQFKPSHTLLNYSLYATFNKTPHKLIGFRLSFFHCNCNNLSICRFRLRNS